MAKRRKSILGKLYVVSVCIATSIDRCSKTGEGYLSHVVASIKLRKKPWSCVDKHNNLNIKSEEVNRVTWPIYYETKCWFYCTYFILSTDSKKANLHQVMLSTLCVAFLRLCEEYPLVEPAIIALVSLYVYYQILVIRPVNLHCKSSSPFTKLLKKHMPILTESYKPTMWVRL